MILPPRCVRRLYLGVQWTRTVIDFAARRVYSSVYHLSEWAIPREDSILISIAQIYWPVRGLGALRSAAVRRTQAILLRVDPRSAAARADVCPFAKMEME